MEIPWFLFGMGVGSALSLLFILILMFAVYLKAKTNEKF